MVMRYITIILLALVCAACSSALPSLKPYRMDIQQGNVVTSEMMLQLRPGMTKSQVRFIMGTPLIQDSFHADRWDYFYEMRKEGKIIERRHVIMEFENDALKRVRGDVIPAGTGEPATEPAVATEPAQPRKKAKEEKGLLDRLKFWKDDEDAQEKPQEAPAELISPAAKPAEPASAVPENKAAPAAQPAAREQAPAEAQPEATPEATTETTPARQEGLPEPGAPLGPDPEHLERGTAPAVEAPQAREIDDSAPQPVAPAPTPAETSPQPAPAATSVPESTAPAKPQQPVEQRSKPAPEPEPEDDDLPPEEDPGYFERMLEKIGF
jgi:outer membrane protein assembly factor BamE